MTGIFSQNNQHMRKLKIRRTKKELKIYGIF